MAQKLTKTEPKFIFDFAFKKITSLTINLLNKTKVVIPGMKKVLII